MSCGVWVAEPFDLSEPLLNVLEFHNIFTKGLVRAANLPTDTPMSPVGKVVSCGDCAGGIGEI